MLVFFSVITYLQVVRWAVYAYIILGIFTYQETMHYKDSEVGTLWMALLLNFPAQAVRYSSLKKPAHFKIWSWTQT